MLGFTFARGALTNEKAPYIVTLFVAALSWTAIRTADRLASVPFVEYQITWEVNDAGVRGIDVRFRNITQASKFDCFTITLATRRRESLKFGDPTQQRHQLRGSVFASFTVKRAKAEEWEVEATSVSPGADIALFVPTSGEGTPALLASVCDTTTTTAGASKDDGGKKEIAKAPPAAVPVLVERSVVTWFVEYEIGILWSALALWAALMMWSLNLVRQKAPRSQVPHIDEVGHDIPDTID